MKKIPITVDHTADMFKALTSLAGDLRATYDAVGHGGGNYVVISLGQWRRLAAIEELIAKVGKGLAA